MSQNRDSRSPPPSPSIATLIERGLLSFQEFVRAESAGAIFLMLCTALALAWANSAWAGSYTEMWSTKFDVGPAPAGVTLSLQHWINDGLMAIFFLLVGLEIKREVLVGELSSARQAALPVGAALGGMLVPATIYALLNAGRAGEPGWGIPMATDIAFALGVLGLLGPRVPSSLRVFLAALAIVDDIGAVLVIALFYTAQISWPSLAAGAAILALLVVLNLAGVRALLPYALLGIGLWLAFLQSGVHATVSGVLLAMTIPARTGGDPLPAAPPSPLERLEHGLQRWVAFGIVPLFALANAGVALPRDAVAAFTDRATLGVITGLLIGKPIGITLFTWGAVRTGLAALPNGVTWKAIHGVSWLGGIGFTMSLFIGELAFGGTELLPLAKLGIAAASLLAGIIGWTLVRATTRGAVDAT